MENKSDQSVLINHNLDTSVGILSVATVHTIFGLPSALASFEFESVLRKKKIKMFFLIPLFIPQIWFILVRTHKNKEFCYKKEC